MENLNINWILIAEIVYIIIIILVCLRIIYDTRSTTKTLAYLLITIFLPILGMAIYFSFGINYRKRKLYNKKIIEDERLYDRIQHQVLTSSRKIISEIAPPLASYTKLAQLLLKNDFSPISNGNKVEILLNGEEKFKAVIPALKNAKKHIHLEYYIIENDAIGNQIKDILIAKAQEGVEVRFIYDDFGSSSIRRKYVSELQQNGVLAYPFYKIRLIALANRLNYRNHRKIIVIDGQIAFTGGINISDRYINSNTSSHDHLYWRDTHLLIEGPGINFLQSLFIADWNFCSGEQLIIKRDFFCTTSSPDGNALVQIAASGPDSPHPTILLSLLQLINLAQQEVLITTPYFIPGESLIDTMIVASQSKVKVKLLVPEKSDSHFVDLAARSYYAELLAAGVEIYMYNKGFVHAKTIVVDECVVSVGTANMDQRSFELNFEVNALVYDIDTAKRLKSIFYDDIKDATLLNSKEWVQRKFYKQIPEKIARLLSPLL
ncbi:cardiolipin synthase [Olivibacter sitiensis]|uniref:cardiolipin synthase n=1 Tax=Olivibacter sitiensis TaxID=376470 RepID=UPI00041BE579|nr:cardiolipin synthase [Olivibacter sitiensis]